MEITLSTGQILSAVAAITVINSAIVAVASWIKGLTAPNKKRERRIKRLEKDVADISDKMSAISESDKVTMQALVALLDSNINGDNVDGLREAREKVTEFLINNR